MRDFDIDYAQFSLGRGDTVSSKQGKSPNRSIRRTPSGRGLRKKKKFLAFNERRKIERGYALPQRQ